MKMKRPLPASRVITVCAATLAVAVGFDLHATAIREQAPFAAPSAPLPVSPSEVLSKYCVTCHNSRLKTAGLMLDTLDVEHVAGNEEVWEKVATKLRTHDMPPRDRRSQTPSGRRYVQDLEIPGPGRANERRPAIRIAGRRPHPVPLPARRRVHHQSSAQTAGVRLHHRHGRAASD